MRTLYFCPMVTSFFLSFFPRLISAAADWMCPYFDTWCGPSANFECRSEMCCVRLAGNTGPTKLPKSRRLGTIAQLCRAISSQLRHVSTVGKTLVKQQYLPCYCPHNMGNLQPTNGWDWFGSLGHPGFLVLAALLHRTLVVGVSRTLRRWAEGATYIRQGGHHVGHWPTFLVLCILCLIK